MLTLGEGVFGRYLDREGGALMNGISALINGTPESFLAFFLTYEDTVRSQAVCIPKEGSYQSLTMLAS